MYGHLIAETVRCKYNWAAPVKSFSDCHVFFDVLDLRCHWNSSLNHILGTAVLHKFDRIQDFLNAVCMTFQNKVRVKKERVKCRHRAVTSESYH